MTSEPHTAPSAPAPQRWSRLFLAIAALFIACLLVANIIAVKLVMLTFVLCDERRRVFEMAGVPDPTAYISPLSCAGETPEVTLQS
jgi:hypothetical protein